MPTYLDGWKAKQLFRQMRDELHDAREARTDLIDAHYADNDAKFNVVAARQERLINRLDTVLDHLIDGDHRTARQIMGFED